MRTAEEAGKHSDRSASRYQQALVEDELVQGAGVCSKVTDLR